MIRVLHNGTSALLAAGTHNSVGEAVEATTHDVVVALRLNGRDVPRETWESVWTFPLDGVTELEIESEPVAVVARRSLQRAQRYAVAVASATRRTAELLREGDVEAASRLLSDVVDALSVLVLTLGAALPSLGEGAHGAAGLDAALAPWLEALADAHGRGDWVSAADLLEYEIAPLVEDWRGRMQTVAPGAVGPAGADGEEPR